MFAFEYSSIFFCVYTSILLCWIILYRRHFLIKPSILVIIFFHVMIQWPGTLQSSYVWSYLPHPWVFSVLLHGFPLIGTAVSLLTWQKESKIVYLRLLASKGEVQHHSNLKVISILAFLVTITVVLYLSQVPITETGLWYIFTNPSGSAIARENSLKLLRSNLVRYMYAFMSKAFVPMLSVLLLSRISFRKIRRGKVEGVFYFSAVMLLLIFVSLHGARSPAAYVILVMLFSFWLKNGCMIQAKNLLLLSIGFLIIVSIPAILSILREGRQFDILVFSKYLILVIKHRLFSVPMLTTLWHTHFAQTQGFVGVSGIPKLAGMLGYETINLPNIIGLQYTISSINSVSANTCYLFAYYTCFGLVALPISLLGLCFLDVAVAVYKILDGRILLPCIAAICVSALSFVFTSYTTALITHGFIAILTLAFALNYVYRIGLKIPSSNLYLVNND